MPQLAELLPLLLVDRERGWQITLVKMPPIGICSATEPITADLRISLEKLEK
jgi:hypothetical protein